jgi:lipoprotein
MKKLYLAIATLALAATLATGCGNNAEANRADSRTETSSKIDGGVYSYNESGSDDSYDSSKEHNSGDENGSYVPPKVGGSRDKSGPNLSEIFKGKPKVDVEEYIRYSYSQEDINKENPRRGYFNLEGYLYAYGATEIKYLGVSKGGMAYGVRFKNGIILGMLFYQNQTYDEHYRDYYLYYFVVSAGSPKYEFTNYDSIDYAETEGTEGQASWSRLFYVDNMRPVDLDYSQTHNRFTVLIVDKTVKCESFYTIGSTTVDGYFYFTSQFDEVFRRCVVPYLSLNNPSLTKDQFSDEYFQ